MEISQKQLQIGREGLTVYKTQINREAGRVSNGFLVELTAPYLEAKLQEIETLATLVDVLLEKES